MPTLEVQRRSARWVTAALLLLAAGCTFQPNQRGDQAAAAPQANRAEIWEYQAAEFPGACMVIAADGSLRFVGGFLFFNPGRWTRDAASGSTRLVLGGDVGFPIGPVTRKTRDYVVPSAPFDSRTRTLRYRITAADTQLEFAGLVFRRSQSCSAT